RRSNNPANFVDLACGSPYHLTTAREDRPMKNQLIGVVLATIAMFFWGFLYWGATTIPYGPLKASNGDEAAQQALLEHFPTTGMYMIPGMHNDTDDLRRMYEAGP